MEWVQRDGSMFLVPARKESRINSFRRWEQAFRLYASIYCDKNPFRAKEIWQYISVIQTALLPMSGRMYMDMTLFSDSKWPLIQTGAGLLRTIKCGTCL